MLTYILSYKHSWSYFGQQFCLIKLNSVTICIIFFCNFKLAFLAAAAGDPAPDTCTESRRWEYPGELGELIKRISIKSLNGLKSWGHQTKNPVFVCKKCLYKKFLSFGIFQEPQVHTRANP